MKFDWILKCLGGGPGAQMTRKVDGKMSAGGPYYNQTRLLKNTKLQDYRLTTCKPRGRHSQQPVRIQDCNDYRLNKIFLTAWWPPKGGRRICYCFSNDFACRHVAFVVNFGPWALERSDLTRSGGPGGGSPPMA